MAGRHFAEEYKKVNGWKSEGFKREQKATRAVGKGQVGMAGAQT